MIIKAPVGDGSVLLDQWCNGPRLVLCTIAPTNSSSVDATGAGFHLEWRAEVRRGNSEEAPVYDRFQPSREAGPTQTVKKWRSSPGTFLCVTGAKLFGVGGVGEWEVEVVSAYCPTNHEEKQRYALQRVINTRAVFTTKAIPEGHTFLMLLAGFLEVGGVTIPPNKPIAADLAKRVGWDANGIIETWCEV